MRARLLELEDPRVPRWWRDLAERAAERELAPPRFACSNGAHCPGRREWGAGYVGARPEFWAVLYFRRRPPSGDRPRLEPRVLLLCRTCARRFRDRHAPDPAPREL